MVTVYYDISGQNTGVDNPLIIGVSVFRGDGTTFVADLRWFVITDLATARGGIDLAGLDTPGISLTTGYTYQAKARAWKRYDLTGAIKVYDLTIGTKTVGAVYEAGTGACYGETKGDGVYLDQETYNFAPQAAYSADIYDLAAYT